MPVAIHCVPPTLSHATWKAHLPSRIKTVEEVLAETTSVYELHHRHTVEHGYFILTSEVADLLAQRFRGQRVVEVGAGLAYLTYHLHQRGVQIVATDSGKWSQHREPYCDIRKLDAAEAITPEYDVVVLTWPPHGSSMALRALQKVRIGQWFLYQGEPAGCCCAEDRFFDLLLSESFERDEAFSNALNDVHVKFPRYHDEWELYRRVA